MVHQTTARWQNAARPTRQLFAFIMLSAVAILTAAPSAMALDAGHVHGLWRTHNGELVRFYACGSQICGQIVTSKAGLRQDKNNPNPKLRNRQVKGLTIIRSNRKSGPAKWAGTVYSVENGRTYRGSLTLTGARSAKLTGCDGAFCQSATWTKISKTRLATN